MRIFAFRVFVFFAVVEDGLAKGEETFLENVGQKINL